MDARLHHSDARASAARAPRMTAPAIPGAPPKTHLLARALVRRAPIAKESFADLRAGHERAGLVIRAEEADIDGGDVAAQLARNQMTALECAEGDGEVRRSAPLPRRSSRRVPTADRSPRRRRRGASATSDLRARRQRPLRAPALDVPCRAARR